MKTASSGQEAHTQTPPTELEVPAPTAWPLVLACGFTFLFAGLLTNVSISVLGAVLAVAGCVGWFREVLPHEHEVTVPVVAEEIRLVTEQPTVERLPEAMHIPRAWLPIETYPISAGVRGGWAGSIAMAALACLFGLLKTGSMWYPINLLAGVVYVESVKLPMGDLNAFHPAFFGIALLLHATVSTLVGLLYGAMLPMFPRRPIILGGLVAPVLWSALLYSTLGLINPLLEARIDWFWFIASQIAFGIVAGLVVVRSTRMPTRENVPFAVRAGIEAPGTVRRRSEEK
jgi:hypothetical protein